MRHDWNQAETFFMNTRHFGSSLKDISDRFNIPYQSVRRYAANHEWHNKRYREWIKERYGA